MNLFGMLEVSGSALGAVLKADILNPARPLGGSGAPSQPVGAVAETTDRVVGYVGVADGSVHGAYYDALASEEMRVYAPNARWFFVGKRACRQSIAQDVLNRLLIKYARRGLKENS